jgi:hypothetical protein
MGFIQGTPAYCVTVRVTRWPGSQVSVIFMAKIQYVSSSAELPTDRQYILVEYGDENRLVRHRRGITMTVDRSMPVNLLEAHAETVIGDAQSMADQENIDTVYVTVPKRSSPANS